MSFLVGEYRAERQLGTSAAARVWRADRLGGGPPVALIRFAPELLPFVEQRAALSMTIRHPHLVRTIGTASAPKHAALITEELTGGSLGRRVRRSPLSAPETVTVLAGVASALAACHDVGLVHGNLRPEAVLFDGAGVPQLAELGAVTATLESGAEVGVSPGFLSPEVARGGMAGTADDVFALGSLAMYCLTGRPAWPADTVRDVVIQSGFGQWPAPGPAVPTALAELIGLMLDRDPTSRPTAAAIHTALSRCGPPAPIELPGPPAAQGVPSADPVPVVADGPRTPPSSAQRAAQAGDDGFPPWPDGDWPGDAGSMAGIRWLDVAVPASAAEASADPDPEAVLAGVVTPEAVSPETMTEPSSVWSPDRRRPRPGSRTGSRRGRHEGLPTRRPRRPSVPHLRWRSAALAVVVVTLLGGGAVVAGRWWAAADSSVATRLPAPGSTSTGPADTPAARSTGVADGSPDWPAVITELDRRRSAAFAAGDISGLAGVYVPGAVALAVDTERIAALAAAGYRVDGLTHQIVAVEVLDPVGPVLRVADSLPAYPIRDGTGLVVGTTTPMSLADRTVTLLDLDGTYLIAVITGDDV